MDSVLESLALLAETVLGPLLATVEGHRTRALELGYSPTAAEAMATTVHHVLLLKLIPIGDAAPDKAGKARARQRCRSGA